MAIYIYDAKVLFFSFFVTIMLFLKSAACNQHLFAMSIKDLHF